MSNPHKEIFEYGTIEFPILALSVHLSLAYFGFIKDFVQKNHFVRIKPEACLSFINLFQDEKYVTVVSPPVHKQKIWKHKQSSFDPHTQTTKLLRILDRDSTLKEKALKPFWTKQSRDISKRLWLLTEIDSVASVLNSSTTLSTSAPMGQSWFSIKKKHPLNKNSLATSFQSSQFSLPKYMDCEAIPLKPKSEKPLKTLKIRLFPNKEQVEQLQVLCDQSRWYYNTAVAIMKNNSNTCNRNEHFYYSKIRDHLSRYEYVEREEDGKIIKDYVFNEEQTRMCTPPWWSNIHSRVPRGAIFKYVSSLNSAMSNLKHENISHFEMSFISKKEPTEFVLFEDCNFPVFIKRIKSTYWFRTRDHRRITLSFQDIFESNKKRGFEIIHDKIADRFMLHYPIECDWFPENDQRNEKQGALRTNNGRLIALDPGVRKFMVGYDPLGEMVFIGEGANKEILNLLHEIDSICSSIKESKIKATIDELKRLKYNKWKQVKNMIDELHWKTISFLMANYDIILLPDFRISKMVKSKLSEPTKRMLYMYSFYKFKTRLLFKGRMYGKKVLIVDESYTSKTCGVCGKLNNVGGKEVYECKECKIKMDRDVNGARNILIKNLIYAE